MVLVYDALDAFLAGIKRGSLIGDMSTSSLQRLIDRRNVRDWLPNEVVSLGMRGR